MDEHPWADAPRSDRVNLRADHTPLGGGDDQADLRHGRAVGGRGHHRLGRFGRRNGEARAGTGARAGVPRRQAHRPVAPVQRAGDLLADGRDVQAREGCRGRDRAGLLLRGQQLLGGRARRHAPGRAGALRPRRRHGGQDPAAAAGRPRHRRGRDQASAGRSRLSGRRLGPAGARAPARAHRSRRDRAAADGLRAVLARSRALHGDRGARRAGRAQAPLPGPPSRRRALAGAAPDPCGRPRHGEHRLRPVEAVREPSGAGRRRRADLRERRQRAPAAAPELPRRRVADEDRGWLAADRCGSSRSHPADPASRAGDPRSPPGGLPCGRCASWQRINVPEVQEFPAFAHAAVAGPHIYVAGMLAVDEKGSGIIEGGIGGGDAARLRRTSSGSSAAATPRSPTS